MKYWSPENMLSFKLFCFLKLQYYKAEGYQFEAETWIDEDSVYYISPNTNEHTVFANVD